MADKLLERKAKTFLKTQVDVEAIKLLYTLADTVGKTQTSKLQHTLGKTLARAKNLNAWRNSKQCVDGKTFQHPGSNSTRNEGRNASLQFGPCQGRGTATL